MCYLRCMLHGCTLLKRVLGAVRENRYLALQSLNSHVICAAGLRYVQQSYLIRCCIDECEAQVHRISRQGHKSMRAHIRCGCAFLPAAKGCISGCACCPARSSDVTSSLSAFIPWIMERSMYSTVHGHDLPEGSTRLPKCRGAAFNNTAAATSVLMSVPQSTPDITNGSSCYRESLGDYLDRAEHILLAPW